MCKNDASSRKLEGFPACDRQKTQAGSLFVPHIFDLYSPHASLPGKRESF